MQRARVERRLAAILAVDVAGYSGLMGVDEEGTHERLKVHFRQLVDPKIKEHHGRVVKNTGDGMLAEFASVVDAVRCAAKIQRGMIDREPEVADERRIKFRVGINLGDVMADAGDIFGDGVNVAARLEALADPGGICASQTVLEHIRDKLPYQFEDLGEHRLKNITRAVRVYRMALGRNADSTGVASQWPLPLPDRPSIAVLPFANMSGDPEQEFFADGIAVDVITALSKSRSLFVIARNSTFTYKGKTVAVKEIGRELGVRYLLEGSVRKSGNRVRVTTQLVEAATGGHLWAERYDRDLADVFAVQDEITQKVSAAIQPALDHRERERAVRKPPETLDAWECYHRGMWHSAVIDAAELASAQNLFRRAIDLDRHFARAHAALAMTYLREVVLFRPDLRPDNIRHALDHARRAVAIDPTDATGHAALAIVSVVSGRLTEAIAEGDLAVSLDPNSAGAYAAQANALAWGGRPRDAIDSVRTAMRLSPFDPRLPGWMHIMARAHYLAEDYAAAIAVGRQLRRSSPNLRPAYNTLIAALGQTGQVDEARALMAEGLERFGDSFRHRILLPASEVRANRPEDREHLIDGFRKAGIVS